MRVRRIGTVVLGAGALLGSAAAQAPRDALDGVEPGLWRLHQIGAGEADVTLCVADPRALLQVRHPGAQCIRHPLDLGPNKAGARYSCPGAGYGQTDLTVENPRLVRIQTQGIAKGQPFADDYEARRVGACP